MWDPVMEILQTYANEQNTNAFWAVYSGLINSAFATKGKTTNIVLLCSYIYHLQGSAYAFIKAFLHQMIFRILVSKIRNDSSENFLIAALKNITGQKVEAVSTFLR